MKHVHFMYPAYEQWRVLSIGEYISHLDFFALYQWLSGALIRIGLFMYLLGTFFSKNMKHYRLNPKLVVVIYLILFALMLIKVESYYFYFAIYKYFLPACIVFFLLQILLSALIVSVLKKRDEKQHGKNNNSNPLHNGRYKEKAEELKQRFMKSDDLLSKVHRSDKDPFEMIFFESLIDSHYLDQYILPKLGLHEHGTVEYKLKSFFQAEDVISKSLDELSEFTF